MTKCIFNGSPCGASDCAQCGILANGQKMKFCKKGGAFFGVGQYTTFGSAGACRYAKDRTQVIGVVIVLGVAIGKPEVVEGKDFTGCGPNCDCATDTNCLAAAITKDPTGKCLEGNADRPVNATGDKFHSRAVNAPNDAHCCIVHATKYGMPMLKTENEIVTFDEGATVPKYLILFDSTKAMQPNHVALTLNATLQHPPVDAHVECTNMSGEVVAKLEVSLTQTVQEVSQAARAALPNVSTTTRVSFLLGDGRNLSALADDELFLKAIGLVPFGGQE